MGIWGLAMNGKTDSNTTILEEIKIEEPKAKEYVEIECKYNAEEINRFAFKDLAKSLNPTSFIFVESTDIYYAKNENEFLRHRLPAENKGGSEEYRSELTFKKKTVGQNNWNRVEVNLRVDKNDPDLVQAFCEGLDYKRNFSIVKSCEIFFYPDADLVLYNVKDGTGKYAHYLEIEANEDIGMTQEEAWNVILKYEKLLAPLGITPQKRKRLSLWEIYRVGFK